jgi:hypothetical protein
MRKSEDHVEQDGNQEQDPDNSFQTTGICQIQETAFQCHRADRGQNGHHVGINDLQNLGRQLSIDRRDDVPQDENRPRCNRRGQQARIPECSVVFDLFSINQELDKINDQKGKEGCFIVLEIRFGNATNNREREDRNLLPPCNFDKGKCYPT